MCLLPAEALKKLLGRAQTPQIGPRPLYTKLDTRTHIMTHVNECSGRRQGHYLHNTQETQEKNTHALSGIRNNDPSNREATDLRLQGHRDRPMPHMLTD